MGFAIVGTVELIKRLFNKDYQSAAIIVGAAIIGALIAPEVGVSWLGGLVMGLQGSGLVTTASYMSIKPVPPVIVNGTGTI